MVTEVTEDRPWPAPLTDADRRPPAAPVVPDPPAQLTRPTVESPDCPMCDYCCCGKPPADDAPVAPHRYGGKGCRRGRRERAAQRAARRRGSQSDHHLVA